MYSAFIDLKRAFDSVYRNGLWYKMIKNGLDGKLFDLIKSIYSEVKLCVKNINTFSDFFNFDVGLLQGEVLSPFLFSCKCISISFMNNINDIEMHLQQTLNASLSLEQLSIYLLLFADDAVIFSETIEGLQSSLNHLEEYCRKWNLEVNVDKTKIVVFRKGGNLSSKEKWTYAGEEIEIVSSFNYLGIVLSSRGAFIKATNTLAGKALKAMNSLLAITRCMKLPINIMFNLFDSFVLSILNYSCEIWGFTRAENIERVHRKFCKWLLNVKMSTNSLSLYGELGRFPLILGRQVRIIKYWLNLHNIKNDNCIFKTLNLEMRNEVQSDPNSTTSWTAKVKYLLEHSGFPDVWLFPESVNIKTFLPLFQSRLRDIYVTEWKQGIELSSALTLYNILKQSFDTSSYLFIVKNIKFRNIIAKLRLSSHQLCIETGRHRGIERTERKCVLCDLNDIEDEYHFVCICPVYYNLRRQYLQKYFYVRPSVYKFIALLNSSKSKVLNNLALYLMKANKLRENLSNQNV